MRRFADAEGRVWDAVVGRESWGAFFAIFVPVTAPGSAGTDIRQAPLDAPSWGEAEVDLDEMHLDTLRELLGRSTPKQME